MGRETMEEWLVLPFVKWRIFFDTNPSDGVAAYILERTERCEDMPPTQNFLPALPGPMFNSFRVLCIIPPSAHLPR